MAKVLLVDDDAAVRLFLERTLVSLGHEVTVAVNGAKALRLVETSSFDLVLTDLVMPDMEGLQLIRELRAMPSPPKIIAMSGGGRGSATDYLQLAKIMGASATLEKPFTQQALSEAIGLVLGTS